MISGPRELKLQPVAWEWDEDEYTVRIQQTGREVFTYFVVETVGEHRCNRTGMEPTFEAAAAGALRWLKNMSPERFDNLSLAARSKE